MPSRRRVIVLGATEAGVSAAFHIGRAALLIEQRNLSTAPTSIAERQALYAAAVDRALPDSVRRWKPPELQATHPDPTWDDIWHQLLALVSGEVRLGSKVTAIDTVEHRLQLSTGESFIYDKLVSTLRLEDFQRLIVDEQPYGIHGIDWWRYWLSERDIELLNLTAQLTCGDIDSETAGKRVAETVRRAMAEKYSAVLPRTEALFMPRVVAVAAPVA